MFSPISQSERYSMPGLDFSIKCNDGEAKAHKIVMSRMCETVKSLLVHDAKCEEMAVNCSITDMESALDHIYGACFKSDNSATSRSVPAALYYVFVYLECTELMKVDLYVDDLGLFFMTGATGIPRSVDDMIHCDFKIILGIMSEWYKKEHDLHPKLFEEIDIRMAVPLFAYLLHRCEDYPSCDIDEIIDDVQKLVQINPEKMLTRILNNTHNFVINYLGQSEDDSDNINSRDRCMKSIRTACFNHVIIVMILMCVGANSISAEIGHELLSKTRLSGFWEWSEKLNGTIICELFHKCGYSMSDEKRFKSDLRNGTLHIYMEKVHFFEINKNIIHREGEGGVVFEFTGNDVVLINEYVKEYPKIFSCARDIRK